MSPRTVLLTTDTTHHLHYAWQLRERAGLHAVLLETRGPTPPFPTAHPFEARRDAYERDVLLGGFSGGFGDLAETRAFDSINDAPCVAALRALTPDVTIVFGTGKLLPETIAASGSSCLNLHGGNPEEYRGLDTHLWTIYHHDWKNLVTTLHHVAPALDTGPIVSQAPLEVRRGMELFELRATNTRVCVELSVATLAAWRAGVDLPARPLTKRGRYYSFMPAVLKEDCVRKFAAKAAVAP